MYITEVQSTPVPHMEVVDKLWKLPAVENTWNISSDIYSRVKSSNSLINWTLSTTEEAVQRAIVHAAPIAWKFEGPIHAVDEKLCHGLEKLEEKVPIVKEQPRQVYENAKSYVCATIQPAVTTVNTAVTSAQGTLAASLNEARKVNVKSLRDLSWAKANEILSHPYGNLALVGLDTTSGFADRCIDQFLPPRDSEDHIQQHVHSNVECDDKLMHTIHTVGILSHKMTRRLYHAISYHLSQVNKENLNEYLKSLALVVSFTNFLNSVNNRVEQGTAPDTTAPQRNE